MFLWQTPTLASLFLFPVFLMLLLRRTVTQEGFRTSRASRVLVFSSLALFLWVLGLTLAIGFPNLTQLTWTILALTQILQGLALFQNHRVSATGPAPVAEDSLPVTQRSSQNKTVILSVDDDAVNRKLIVAILKKDDVVIVESENAAEALEIIKTRKIDLVLLDVMLPGMSGFECCKVIRQTHSMAELPVIMVTAKDRTEDFVEGFLAGANDYVTKPIIRTELQARLKSHIELVHLNNSYRRFVPNEFFNYMGKDHITDVQLGDHSLHEMAILFADIRSFTSLSETMSPEETFRFLNSYLSYTVPVVKKNRGFVDKYIGDEIMALFPEGGEWGVQAAIQLQMAIQQYNKHRKRSGYPAIQVGVGVHSGTLILGTVGEESRIESTVISDAVNTASRIESLAKKLNAPILISQNTLIQLNDPMALQYRFLGRVMVKGKKESLALFEIFDGSPPEDIQLKKVTRSEFENGVVSYSKGNFAEATKLFQSVLKKNPSDNAARYYLDNSDFYLTHSVPQDWDGALNVLV